MITAKPAISSRDESFSNPTADRSLPSLLINSYLAGYIRRTSIKDQIVSAYYDWHMVNPIFLIETFFIFYSRLTVWCNSFPACDFIIYSWEKKISRHTTIHLFIYSDVDVRAEGQMVVSPVCVVSKAHFLSRSGWVPTDNSSTSPDLMELPFALAREAGRTHLQVYIQTIFEDK